MKLNEVNDGQEVVVVEVGGSSAERNHLLNMGLIPGTLVKLVKTAPMGDPIELRLHDYELAIRKDQASQIKVNEFDEQVSIGDDVNAELIQSCEDAQNDAPLSGDEAYKFMFTHNCDTCKKDCKFNLKNKNSTVVHDKEEVVHPGFGEAGIHHDKKTENPQPDKKTLKFALVGNQNSGKTTLFNQLTGAKQHVGNFPGVTVDRKDGIIKGHPNTQITDLPGIYSMSPYTKEEIISREFALQPDLDCIINIVDATCIERSLNLTMQLLEMDVPVVVALNMMDEVRQNNGTIHVNTLEKRLGTPVVPISAAKNEGIGELIEHAIHIAKFQEKPVIQDFCLNDKIGGAVHRAIHSVMHSIEDHCQEAQVATRFAAVKLIEGDNHIEDMLKLDENEKKSINLIAKEMEDSAGLDRVAAISDMRYRFIIKVSKECVVHGNDDKPRSRSEKADKFLTGKFTGIPAFILIMAFVFWITFSVIGPFLQDFVEEAIKSLGEVVADGLANVGASEVIQSLVMDGIFAGVGSVVSFLPLIILLFFFLSILEDSGYMARVAFVMDKMLRRLGLSGRSIIPMLIGFGCSVPAIMSARTLPSERDRKLAILLTPYMSCSAKLPIYSFISVIFFPQCAGLVMVGLYVLGILIGIIVALCFKRGGKPVPFIMELPNYRFPSAGNVGHLLWDKCKDFLKRAFTIILVATIVVWFLQNFSPTLNMVDDSQESILAVLAG